MSDRVLVRLKATNEKKVARSYSTGVLLPDGTFVHRTQYKLIKPLPEAHETKPLKK